MATSISRGGAGWSVAIFTASLLYLVLRVPEADFLLVSNDQGYQMALGMAVAGGRLPGFDFITQYGPAVAFASYFGFALTGNAVGEMLISAIGYAATIAIATSIVRPPAGRCLAILTALAMLLWFPRFYKWYYCLFPILGLKFAQTYFASLTENRRNTSVLIVWSQIVGISALFRYDLGVEGEVFGVLAILAAHYANGWSSRRRVFCEPILFTGGAVALSAVYMTAIFLTRDVQRLSMFVRSIYDGAVDTVDYYRVSPFRFDPSGGLSAINALPLLQIIVPLTYLAGAVMGARALRSSTRTTVTHGFVLFCASLVGLGVYPQALHRADLQHLLQVIYPFLVTLALLAALLFGGGQPGHWFGRLVGSAVIIGILAVMLILLPGSGFDLGPLFRDSATAWETVADLPDSRPNNPTAAMAIALRRLTPRGASVFLVMVPTDMPLLFFSQRSQPGIFPVYEQGMFAGGFWLRRSRAALEAAPPGYLVVTRTRAVDDPAPFIPGLVREWRSEYKTVLYQNERYKLLTAR